MKSRKEEKAPFYTFQYGPFQIATARPETKFGDKYVVMHPEDERYLDFKHGDTFECEWINGPCSRNGAQGYGDRYAFGTGVMTITPWHDATDFEIAERHGLERSRSSITRGSCFRSRENLPACRLPRRGRWWWRSCGPRDYW
jgi:valyl-tRNA synthetase